jgi:hypothetical protein
MKNGVGSMHRIVTLIVVAGLLVPCGARSEDDINRYGEKARYELLTAVVYPDFRLVYRDQQSVADSADGARPVVYRHFDINTDCTSISVSWSPTGTGSSAITVDIATGSYVLEFGHSIIQNEPLAADEVVAWEKPAYQRALEARRVAIRR